MLKFSEGSAYRDSTLFQCHCVASQWVDPDTKIFPRLHNIYVQAYMGRAFTVKGSSTVDYWLTILTKLVWLSSLTARPLGELSLPYQWWLLCTWKLSTVSRKGAWSRRRAPCISWRKLLARMNQLFCAEISMQNPMNLSIVCWRKMDSALQALTGMKLSGII